MLHVQPHFQRRRVSVEQAEAEERLEQAERERQWKGMPKRATKMRRDQKKSARKAVLKASEPFGGSDKWKALKASMLPGDELWEFCSDRASWNQGLGQAGFAVVRDGKTVFTLVVRVN